MSGGTPVRASAKVALSPGAPHGPGYMTVMGLASYLAREFGEGPLPLPDVVFDSQRLGRLARLTVSVLEQSQPVSTEDARVCALAVRHLCSREGSAKGDTNILQADGRARSYMSFQTTESYASYASEEIEEVKETIQAVSKQNAALARKVTNAFRNRDEKISLERHKTRMMEVRYRDAVERLKIAEEAKRGLTGQLAAATRETEELTAELTSSNERLAAYREKVASLRIKNKAMKSRTNDSSQELDKSPVSKMSQSADMSQDESLSIEVQIENRVLSTKVSELERRVVGQQKVMDDMSETIRMLEAQKIREEKGHAARLAVQKAEWEKEREGIQRENSAKMAGKVEELKSVVSEVRKLKENIQRLEDQPPNVPQIIIRKDDTEKIEKLSALVNGFSVFVHKVFVNREVDTSALLNGVSVRDMKAVQKQVEETVSRARSLVEPGSRVEKLFETVFGDASGFDPVLAAFSGVLSSFAETRSVQKSGLDKMKEFLELDCADGDICEAAISHVSGLYTGITEIAALLKGTGFRAPKGSVFDALKRYVGETDGFIQSLEQLLGTTPPRDVRFTELLAIVTSLVKELEESRESLHTSDLEDSQWLVEKDKAFAGLEERLAMTERLLDISKKSVENAKSERNAMETQVNLLKKEKTRLQDLMKEHASLFDERMAHAVSDERSRSAKESSRLQARVDRQLKLIEDERRESNEKLATAKRKHRELLDTHRAFVSTHGERIDAVTEENIALRECMSDSQSQFSVRVETLQDQLRRALAVTELPTDCDPDGFTAALGQTFGRCFNSDRGWTKRRILSAANTLVERYISSVTDNL